MTATKSFVGKLFTSAALWVFVLTFVVLAIHPIPECFACEYPHPWGRDQSTRDWTLLAAWLIVASFLAGSWGIKKNWPVPISIVMAHLMTQPIGGVALWSLLSNEGPMILALGLPTGGASLLLGCLVRRVVGQMRRSTHQTPT